MRRSRARCVKSPHSGRPGAGSCPPASPRQALALNQLPDERGALEFVQRSLELAEPEGYVRIFADEGEPMAVLLRQALGRGVRPHYVGTLISACG